MPPPKRLPDRDKASDAYERAVERWLDRGGHIDARYGHAEKGLTMLMHASSHGLLSVVELLLERGASLDLQSGSAQFTALMYAVRNGRYAVVQVLLEAGASYGMRDSFGRSASQQHRCQETLDMGGDVYLQCVPPNEGVNVAINLLKEHIGRLEKGFSPIERALRAEFGTGGGVAPPAEQPASKEPSTLASAPSECRCCGGSSDGSNGGSVAGADANGVGGGVGGSGSRGGGEGAPSPASACVDDGTHAACTRASGGTDSVTSYTTPSSSTADVQTACAVCGSAGRFRCGGCRTVRYCSSDCQRVDWPAHRALCTRGKAAAPS